MGARSSSYGMSATAGEPRCVSAGAVSHSSGTSSSPVHTVPQGNSSLGARLLLGGGPAATCPLSVGSLGGVTLAMGVGLGGRCPSCEAAAAVATALAMSTALDGALDVAGVASPFL